MSASVRQLGWSRGWNIDCVAVVVVVSAVSTCIPLGCGGKRWRDRGDCPDTLLGPEDSGASLDLMANEKLTICCGGGCWLWALPVGELSLCVGGGRRGLVGCCPYVENYTVDASIFVAQVFKGARWMPWHQEPKKDVGICDKPRGVDNQTVIRGFPNGETRLEASPVTPG